MEFLPLLGLPSAPRAYTGNLGAIDRGLIWPIISCPQDVPAPLTFRGQSEAEEAGGGNGRRLEARRGNDEQGHGVIASL